jgi:alkylation response protein AidB-like acyl-CoA dehydrogenase
MTLLTDLDLPDDCRWVVAPGIRLESTEDGWRLAGDRVLAVGPEAMRRVAGLASTADGRPALFVARLVDSQPAGEDAWRVRLDDVRVRVTDAAGLDAVRAELCLRQAAECLDVTRRCVDLAQPAVPGRGQGTEFAVAEVAMDANVLDALLRSTVDLAGPARTQHALAARVLGYAAARRGVDVATQAIGWVDDELAGLIRRARRAAVAPPTVDEARTALGDEVHSGRFTLPEPAPDHAELRDLVRRFVTGVLLPHEAALHRDGDLPKEVWAELEHWGRDLDLSALGVPVKHGGAGLGLLGQLVAAEEMGSVAVGFRHIVGTPAGALPVAYSGTDEQRERYLAPWLRGERWGGWATTEPEAGSDLGAIRSTATRTDKGWRISGAKHFITGLDRADFVTTFVKTDPAAGVKGLTAFLLDLDQPGVTIGAQQPMMGREGLHSYELRFDDVEVSDAQRLGEVNQGFALLIGDVNRMRVLMAAHCVGVARRLVDIAAAWGRTRVQFGRPIGEFEALRWYLADSAAELVGIRAATYDTAARVDAGEPVHAESATVKAYGTELAGRVADRAVQILGGTGYSKGMPVEALYRAVRVWRIAEGSSEIQRMLVGRQLAAGWRPGRHA